MSTTVVTPASEQVADLLYWLHHYREAVRAHPRLGLRCAVRAYRAEWRRRGLGCTRAARPAAWFTIGEPTGGST